MLYTSSQQRPIISVQNTKASGLTVMHNSIPTRVVFTRELISIGCTDITVDAAKYIIDKYKEAFPELTKEVILQP